MIFDLLRSLFTDPRLLNYLLMAIYVGNTLRWAVEKKWDSLYWFGALLITIAVTLRASGGAQH